MYPGNDAQGYRVGTIAWQQAGNRSLGNNSTSATSPPPRPAGDESAPGGAKPRATILGREITIALLIKLALLFAIWLAFFSHPLDRKLGPGDIDRLLLGSANHSSLTDSPLSSPVPGKESRHDP
jgi:hypothetical protein